jgi:hypothetical protein
MCWPAGLPAPPAPPPSPPPPNFPPAGPAALSRHAPCFERKAARRARCSGVAGGGAHCTAEGAPAQASPHGLLPPQGASLLPCWAADVPPPPTLPHPAPAGRCWPRRTRSAPPCGTSATSRRSRAARRASCCASRPPAPALPARACRTPSTASQRCRAWTCRPMCWATPWRTWPRWVGGQGGRAGGRAGRPAGQHIARYCSMHVWRLPACLECSCLGSCAWALAHCACGARKC